MRHIKLKQVDKLEFAKTQRDFSQIYQKIEKKKNEHTLLGQHNL